ncbi:MAG: hypothetical protein HY826_12605 [Actinobacteria bacterium]|nr:hypothetical protein [Actinomycetota bacterium]
MPYRPTNAGLQATRVLWLATALVLTLAIDGAAEGRQAIAGTVSTPAWWGVCALVVVALVVCGPVALTVVRIVVPTSVAVAGVTVILGASAMRGGGAVAVAILASVSAFTAETGEAMVQVAAYGDERRLPLRVPAAMQLPMAVSWLLWSAASLGGFLAIAADRAILGYGLLLVACALTWILSRRFHRFSCRWLVSVPAGIVVHDHFVLAETLMVMRPNVERAQLALAGTDAADLSGPAAGHALEITLRESTPVVFAATASHPKGRAIHATAFLTAPSRPGRALHALADRKIPVS